MPTSIFTRPTIWVCIALFGFLLLPSQALDYGLWGATHQEWLNAMGWSSINICWLWFLPLFIYLYPFPNHRVSIQWQLCGIIVLFTTIFLTAILYKIRFGYAVICLILALIALATNYLAQLNLMKGNRFILASLIAIVLFITLFILYPTLSLTISMVNDQSTDSSTLFFHIFNQPYLWKIMTNSLSVSLTVGLFSTLFGLIFALYTTRIAKHSLFISKIFSLLPIVTPPFVVGLGVTLMLGRSGYITDWLVTYCGFSKNWLYGFTGIALSHTLALTPMAFMILSGALQSLNTSLEEMAYTLKANRYQVFFNIILPLLKPALANAFLIVVIQSLADFSTPFVLGGNFDVIATQIYFSIAGSQLDYPMASQLGMILLLFSLIIFIIQYLWIGKRSYVTISGKTSYNSRPSLPKTMNWGISITLIIWIGFNLLLYGSIFYGSFTKNWGVDHSLTLDNYRYLFGQGLHNGGFPSLIHTLIFSIVSAPITAIIGLLLAYLIIRCQFQTKKILEFTTLLCFAIPGTVAGLSYVLAFNNAPIYLSGTVAIVILSMITRNLPIGMRSAIAGLQQIDRNLDEASLSLRANTFQTIRFILLPLLTPALFSALVTSFVRAMTTVSAIIFLVNADTRVATSYILNRVEDGEYGLAVAYGASLIIVMMSLILLSDWLLKKWLITKTS